MFAESHKIVSKNVCKDLCDKHDLQLNERNFLWGSVLPDIHPKYRSKSHYPDGSFDYIVGEISKLIFAGRFIDFESDRFYGISNKLFSRKLGIISHFLADFVCRPHYEGWTFSYDLVSHVKYERDLARLAPGFKFSRASGLELNHVRDAAGYYNIYQLLAGYLHAVLDAYGEDEDRSLEKDLVYAYNLNLQISDFILETIILYNKEKAMKKLIIF